MLTVAKVLAFHFSGNLFSKQYAALFLAILCLLMGRICAGADLRSNINAWKNAFDLVTVDNLYVQRVQNIFKRLKLVAGKDVLLSELYIVNSDNEPWAIALQDGNVVLSRGALDIVYGDSQTSMEVKDAQMAFILGHELSHIAKSDFWHEQVYRSFVNRDAGEHSPTMTDRASRRRESELRADEDGFIFASLAGFNTRAILSNSHRETDFLEYWVTQTRTGLGKMNFSARERAEFLNTTLEGMDEAVKLFQYGTRLAHFGFYTEARLLLEEFYRIYPSSQVLNNLGYVYLQQARQAMPIDLSAQFWFPFLLDTQAGVPEISRSLFPGLSEEAKSHLLKATKFLGESITQSSTNVGPIKNLAIAHLYLNEYGKARMVLESAMSSSPDDHQLQSLMAIAVLHDSNSADQWKVSLRNELVSSASQPGAALELIYNTARTLENIGFELQAKGFWQRLAVSFDQLPDTYQRLLCQAERQLPECQEGDDTIALQLENWAPENVTGILPGANVDNPDVRQLLSTWNLPFSANLSGPDIQIYEHPNGNSLLAIDGVVTVINQKLHRFDFKQHLLDENHHHQQRAPIELRVSLDSVLHSGYNWAAEVREEEILEIWFADTRSTRQ